VEHRSEIICSGEKRLGNIYYNIFVINCFVVEHIFIRINYKSRVLGPATTSRCDDDDDEGARRARESWKMYGEISCMVSLNSQYHSMLPQIYSLDSFRLRKKRVEKLEKKKSFINRRRNCLFSSSSRFFFCVLIVVVIECRTRFLIHSTAASNSYSRNRLK
jgi:hypothetical protein